MCSRAQRCTSVFRWVESIIVFVLVHVLLSSTLNCEDTHTHKHTLLRRLEFGFHLTFSESTGYSRRWWYGRIRGTSSKWSSCETVSMATVCRIHGTSIHRWLLCRLFGQSILSFCWQIGEHLHHRHQIRGMGQICQRNRRASIEYTEFHGEPHCATGDEVQSNICSHLLQAVIGQVERNINVMLQFQSQSRSIEARDYALLVDNNAYVQNWSLTQIVVILLTCSIQVIRNCVFTIHRIEFMCGRAK